jgi:hypothetical protein
MACKLLQVDISGGPGGTRTHDLLTARYLALYGVAARMARGAKPVQLSSEKYRRI